MLKKIALEIFENAKRKGITSQDKLNLLKKQIAKKHGMKKIPTNIDILNALPQHKKDEYRLFTTKPGRTSSGVAVVAIMSYPYKCPHGRCAICPGGPDSYFGTVPQSYTGREPATRRAIRNEFDAYLQVMNRLEQYVVINQVPEKVELIIMGGTFPSFENKYQREFVMYALKAMNDFSRFFIGKKLNKKKFNDFFELPGSVDDLQREKRIISKLKKMRKRSSLEKEQKRNESSVVRCVGLTVETRPDYANLEIGDFLLELGCTRVELGVQSVYDDMLKSIRRGHSVKDSVEAIQTLKELGFKLNLHYMIGLPGWTKKKDVEGLKQLFSDARFMPDMLKIYPCMVLKGTKLYKKWKKKEFRAMTTKEAARVIFEFKRFVPEYCRIMRVQRDIPTNATEAGVDRTNLRQYIDAMDPGCRCIRCREVGHVYAKKRILPEKIEIIAKEYIASQGREFFISAEDIKKDILVGFCRMRFPSKTLRKEITEDTVLIRELHVYGKQISLGKKGTIQHTGYGKKLLKNAEMLAKEFGKKKIVIISGIGVRAYYRKLGYRKEGPYMIKNLTPLHT